MDFGSCDECKLIGGVGYYKGEVALDNPLAVAIITILNIFKLGVTS